MTLDVPGFIDAITPGSWPDWFAAIGTTAAFAVAAVAYTRDVSARRWAQARLIYCKVLDSTGYPAAEPFPILNLEAAIGGGDIGRRFVTGSVPHQFISDTAFVLSSVAVHNGSDELIGPVWVQAFNPGNGQSWDFAIPFGFVEPHSHRVAELYCSNPAYPAEPNVLARVVFRDSRGRWWRRSGWDMVVRSGKGPADDPSLRLR